MSYKVMNFSNSHLDLNAYIGAYVPISILSGTPFLSHSKYLAPGRTFSLSSTLTLQVMGWGDMIVLVMIGKC
jgi:hypothetical protein